MMMENKNSLHELSDDELDAVSGGITWGGDSLEVGNRVLVNVRCACCGKADVTGTISAIPRPKRDGVLRISVTMDCCGGVGTYTLSYGAIIKL